jgi:hypothetical protein
MAYTPPHTVSKDELIGTLLQLWRADCPLALDGKPENIVRDLEFAEEEEQALGERTNDGNPTTRLELISQYLKIAAKLDGLLTGAINSRRLNKDTGLLTVVLYADERDPKQYEDGYFTTRSAYCWADEEFNIKIAKWAAPERLTELDEHSESSAKRRLPALEENEIEKLEVLIALLSKHIVSRAGVKFGSIEKPNCLQISNLIREDMKVQRVVISGFSDKGLRSKLGDSLKTAQRYTTEE